MSSTQIGLLYAIAVNLTAFGMYGVDKVKAVRHRWRIPERTLFLIAFVGGGAGALLGMIVFHHKTRKTAFRIGIPLALIINILVFLKIFNG